MANLDQKYGLTPLEKTKFFDFFNIWFLQLRKAFFRSRISYNIFPWPRLPKKKKMKKSPILNQNHGLTPFEKSQFFDFF